MMVSRFSFTWLVASNQQHEAINTSHSYQQFSHGGLYWRDNRRTRKNLYVKGKRRLTRG